MKLAFLMGFRAAGKSTLGKAMAGWNGLQFFDLDEEIERSLGQSILDYVDAHGIGAFRTQEARALREILSGSIGSKGQLEKPILVALGGGIVDGDDAYQLLKTCPYPKIHLDVSPETLWKRLEPFPDRRKIGKLQSFSDLESLFQKRAPRWKEIATHTLENQDISQGLLGLKKILGSVWQAAL